mgnify:CR=1 FL=1|jgi:hypothetical protein
MKKQRNITLQADETSTDHSSNHPQSDSILIHEDQDLLNYMAEDHIIRGLEKSDIPIEKRALINDPTYFQELSLSFYPKELQKNQEHLHS